MAIYDSYNKIRAANKIIQKNVVELFYGKIVYALFQANKISTIKSGRIRLLYRLQM